MKEVKNKNELEITESDWIFLSQGQTKQVIGLLLKVLAHDRDQIRGSVYAMGLENNDKLIQLGTEVSKIRGFEMAMHRVQDIYDRANKSIKAKKEDD